MTDLNHTAANTSFPPAVPTQDQEKPSQDVVGVVGSPSSTSKIVLDITGDANDAPLLGSMVTVEQQMRERTEVALGTVTEITTENPWHENIAMRGVIATHGSLMGLSGRADIRGAQMHVQAVYELDGGAHKPAGATLTMSPKTGTNVHRVTDAALTAMTRAVKSKFYLGDIYRMPGVRLPLNPPDFSGARGAFHAGVFGPSGVGKSVFTMYYLAGQLRHPDLAIFIVDPQGQYSIERPTELTFSLQGLAKAMGREVIIHRLATDLQMPQNKYLFAELLAKTAFFRTGLNIRTGPAVDGAIEVVTDFLERTTGWSKQPPDELMRQVLTALREAAESGDIYKDVGKKGGAAEKLQQRITETLDDVDNRWARVGRYFTPIASLFHHQTTTGQPKTKMSRLLHQAFEREEGRPRPLIILDMTFDGHDDDDDVARVLNSEPTKARILRTLFDEVAGVAGRDYRDKGEKLLNVLVVFDEAWRYAPRSSSDDEIKALSEKLAEYGRITRKYGLGWMYVLQNPHELNTAVWESLKSGFRAFGYGLTGADLDLIKAQVDSPDSITLYRSFTQPSTMNKQYPFMLVGAISPLSFTMTPLYTSVYTDFHVWCSANQDWLPAGAEQAAQLTGGQPSSNSPRPSNDIPSPDFM